jgi:hypothetical protein
MGLDMYLYKKHYVKNWDWMADHEKHTISVKKGKKKVTNIKPERISHVVELVGEWRKFNALHGWFVNECAAGVDECQNINVDEDKLKELLETLKEVSSNFDKAKELLPPVQGFFFGGDEVDEYYKEDVNSTIKIIEELLEEHEQSKEYGLYSGDFEYRASW